MPKDLTGFLWLLKLGAPLNLYFLASTWALLSPAADPHILVPAQVFFAVSAYRCLFPNRYEDNVVFHDSPLSSIFLTRLLATFSEVAYIYLFSRVIRLLNVEHVAWVDALSWLMVLQVVISQGFVWRAILTGRRIDYFYEEVGWAILFAANTLASAYLLASVESQSDAAILLQLNLLFGMVYLPWQLFFHLRALRADAGRGEEMPVAEGLRRSIHERKPTSDARAWGGLVGLTWMTAYWAALIPPWIHLVVVVLSR